MKIHKDKITATLEKKERFNPYQTGHGVWKSKNTQTVRNGKTISEKKLKNIKKGVDKPLDSYK